MECKFCYSKDISIIKHIRSPYFDNDFSLFQCYDCKCGFFNYFEYEIDTQDFYQNLSQNHQATINPAFKKKKSWIDLKSNLINILGKKPVSVLDVGCRTGDFLMHFDDTILREGVELAEDYADIAKARGLIIYNDFIENITFQKKYEIVSCLAILEHLIEPVKFLNTLNELVEDQGILVIMIPTIECLKEKILNFLNIRWHMYCPPEHLNFYSRYYLDEFMIQNGFTLVGRKYTSGGMLNPFASIKILKIIFSKFMYYYDQSVFNRIPIFDHMYSIYKKS